MKKITITTQANEDAQLVRNSKLIREAVRTFQGKPFEIILQPKRKSRSNPQNNYLWGVCVPLIQSGLHDCTGEIRDAQSIYRNILLPLFAPSRDITNVETGEVLSEKITSSEMSTVEFISFIDAIQKWSAEFLGIDIPNPGEATEIQFN